MTGKKIYSLVSILTLISILGILILYFFTGFGKDILLSVIGLAFMLVSSLVFIPVLSRSIASSDLSRFLKVFMIKIFVKMVGIISIVVLYFRLVDVSSKMIVFPFLAIYLMFTILITIYAYRIALIKLKKNANNAQTQAD